MCGRVLSEHPSIGECKCHDEHIIPNAIGGHLTSRDFLCESCGGAFSKGDSEFAKIMSPFIVLLNQAGLLRPLDRDNVDKKSLYGSIFENNALFSEPIMDIRYAGGKAIPSKPTFKIDNEQKRVIIYAAGKAAKNIQVLARKELKRQGLDSSEYLFDVCDDMLSHGFLGINFSKGITNFNEKFKDGLLKMAVEFALHSGIARKDLASVLDIDNNTNGACLKGDASIWLYIPLSIADVLYENERYKIDSNYPSHVLRVFSEEIKDGGKYLLCYIELFSTFQYYVMLNEDYKGKDIDNTYSQKLCSNYMSTLDELLNLDNSDLDIEIREAGISLNDISGKKRSEICKMIYEVQRKRGSEYDLFQSAEKGYSWISNQILFLLSGDDKAKQFVKLDKSSIDVFNTLLKNKDFTLSELKLVFEEQPKKAYFRKTLLDKQNEEVVGLSYPALCMDYYKNHIDLVKEYTTAKFSHLSKFCLEKAKIRTE